MPFVRLMPQIKYKNVREVLRLVRNMGGYGSAESLPKINFTSADTVADWAQSPACVAVAHHLVISRYSWNTTNNT